MLYWIGWGLYWLIYKFIFRLKIIGGDNIPPEGGAIIASNHASLWDPPLVGVAVGIAARRGVYFLAKEELFRFPVFSFILKQVHAFPIKRRSGDLGAFRTALRLLSQGKILLVFPQGTRMKKKDHQRARPGVGLLWKKSGVPVIPAFLKNTDRSSRFPQFVVKFGAFCKPQTRNEERDYQKRAQEILKEIFSLEEKMHET